MRLRNNRFINGNLFASPKINRSTELRGIRHYASEAFDDDFN